MVKMIPLVALLGVSLIAISINLCYCSRHAQQPLSHICSPYDVVNLFTHTPDTIKKRVTRALEQAQKEIEAIIAIPDTQRTFANTAQALDTVSALSDAAILVPVLSALELVSPDAAIRDAAHVGSLSLREFFIDQLSNNERLYLVFKAYANSVGIGGGSETAHAGMSRSNEALSSEQRYFIQETVKDFERNGLNLSAEKLSRVRVLKKELAALALTFEKNVAQDNRTITVSHAELAGLDDDFIASLKKVLPEQQKQDQVSDSISGELYELAVNAPTMLNVMKNCAVSTTRKKMYQAWENRAYPINEPVLKAVIAKRDELAKLLGFESFSAYDIDDQMAQSPIRVESFLHDLIAKAQEKEKQEFAQLFSALPDSVQQTADGKLQPWDVQYVKTQYKKKHLDVDDRVVAYYFPTEKTIEKLFGIYQRFFSLTFKQEAVAGLWHDQVKLVSVYSTGGATEELLGYLLLDLYPRPNKYGHAAHETLIPAVLDTTGKALPSVAIVIANFPQPTPQKPSLLLHRDVEDFFHEFGHAMHSMLGRTKLASQAGTNVKNDFVEVPSQMFEEWLWDADILRQISAQYQTGIPLPDDLIKKIIALKKFDSGYFVQRQSQLSLLDLAYFNAGADKDLYAILQDHLRRQRYVAYDPDDHMYASFGHLMGYGAKYYSYLWSKVYALDLFAAIKKEGLTNPAVGQRLVAQVLGKGGSAEPGQLLRNFLGREPDMHAFLEDLGLMGVNTH